MNILDEIAGRTRERIQEEKRKQSLLDLKYRIREQERQAPSFYGALTAPTMRKDQIIVVTISGRGDKDCAAIARYRGEDLHE